MVNLRRFTGSKSKAEFVSTEALKTLSVVPFQHGEQGKKDGVGLSIYWLSRLNSIPLRFPFKILIHLSHQI